MHRSPRVLLHGLERALTVGRVALTMGGGGERETGRSVNRVLLLLASGSHKAAGRSDGGSLSRVTKQKNQNKTKGARTFP